MYNKPIKKINRIGKIGHIVITVILLLSIVYTVLLSAEAVVVNTNAENAFSVSTLGNKTFVNLNCGFLEKTFVYRTNSGLNQNLIYLPYSQDPIEISTNASNDSSYISVSADISSIYSQVKKSYNMFIITGIITSITSIIALIALKALLKYISRCKTPFDNTVVKKLRLCAFAFIPAAIATSVTNSYISTVQNPSNEFVLYINKVLFAAIIMIFVLAYILKYGILLQKESDETL